MTNIMTETMTKKYKTLTAAVADLNKVISDNGNPTVKLNDAKEAVKAINAQIADERMTALRAMPADAMWAEYLDHQFCLGYALDQNKDNGRYSIRTPEDENAATVRVSFAALDNAGDRLSRMEQWPIMLRILCENIVIHTAKDMGDQYVSRNAMSSALVEKRKAMGPAWQPDSKGNVSMNKLVDMLNQVVFAIIPDNVCKPMIKADVRYIAAGLISAKKSKKDEAGQLAVRNAVSMEEFLFRAIYTRRNGLAYAFQNKQEKETSAKKDPNAADALPSEYVETVEAGPVEVVEATPVTESAPAAEEIAA